MYHICAILLAKPASGSHGSFHLRRLLLILLVSIDDDAGNDQHDNECNIIPFHSVSWGFIGLEIE